MPGVRPSCFGGRALALALFSSAALLIPSTAHSQEIAVPSDLGNGQMLLESDTLVYDNDNQTVTAVGAVRIDYNGYKLVAERVVYNQRTGRLIASGGVELVDASGTKVSSEKIDITDDFKDGFVQALRVETADKIYFGAESASREGGHTTTFMNGVYTACEPCEDDPDKAPIWRVKARKIIWNGKAKTIRFERPRFELFGLPIAGLPFFEIADPTVKRKSGFLFPSIGFTTELGYSVKVPYYLVLAPTHDATFYGSYYTNQGFLGEAEWRKRFEHGSMSVRLAGIIQSNPGLFGSGTVDGAVTGRAMIGSTGRFALNERWTFGWDVLAQTDKSFSYRYKIDGFTAYNHTSQIFLTGLNDRNFFDLRAQKFQIQESILDTNAAAANPVQPWVLPTFDYSWTADNPVAGGEFNVGVNSRILKRALADNDGTALRGAAGLNSRLSAEVEWKRTFVTSGGLAITALLAARGDSHHLDGAAQGSILAFDAGADVRAAYWRAMATAGLELRWPVLFSTTSATHVLEPVAQIFVRPNEMHATTLGIPNEDAQSLVFDATSLFDRDKFSGWDRMEGGTRANLGLRYSGSFANGWTANAVFGQSFHIAGVNSFASPDLVNAGVFSGLESARSDYVGMIGVANDRGTSASVKARFDEQTFEVRRAEAAIAVATPKLSFSGRYAYIQAQPGYGFPNDRHEVTLAGKTHLNDKWSVYGSGTYDLASNVMTKASLGAGYADECTAYSLTYNEYRAASAPATVSRSFGFHVSLRTIGDFGTDSSAIAK
ncbi:MAG: LPS-assembly protein LptD [Phyllobacteriaceae bacterium]|nr:LPS-assembly protein LptD [Phyllobacteriaceae bacterium]